MILHAANDIQPLVRVSTVDDYDRLFASLCAASVIIHQCWTWDDLRPVLRNVAFVVSPLADGSSCFISFALLAVVTTLVSSASLEFGTLLLLCLNVHVVFLALFSIRYSTSPKCDSLAFHLWHSKTKRAPFVQKLFFFFIHFKKPTFISARGASDWGLSEFKLPFRKSWNKPAQILQMSAQTDLNSLNYSM